MTGQPRHLQHVTIAVAATTTILAAADPRRTYMLLQNDSDTDIYLMNGDPAVVGQGVRLVPNGGSFEMSPRNGNLDQRQINAIHGSTGTKNLLVTNA